MKIHNEFDVPLPPLEAWETLCDIEEIVQCLPGAEITEKVDELVYRGHIAVKLGPVALRFRGTTRFTDLDAAGRRASLQALAQDEKGRGGVHTLMDFHLEPAEDGSRVFVDTELKLSGNIAQYGRATGIVELLADQIVGEFANNLQIKLDENRSRVGGERAVEADADRQRGKPIPAIGLVFKLLGGWFTRWIRALFRRL